MRKYSITLTEKQVERFKAMAEQAGIEENMLLSRCISMYDHILQAQARGLACGCSSSVDDMEIVFRLYDMED